MTSSKLYLLPSLKEKVLEWKSKGEKVVFTNGCFDVFHAGHAYLLNTSKTFGSKLIVAVNSDESVTKLKGAARPINNAVNRVYILNSMEAVDAIILFEDETPHELIKALLPDILVKGGDYSIETIVGAKEVISNGGKVEIVPLMEGLSSTHIIATAKNIEQ